MGIFLGLLKFQIFLGCLKFLIFFGVNGRCWAEPTYEGKMRVPPGAFSGQTHFSMNIAYLTTYSAETVQPGIVWPLFNVYTVCYYPIWGHYP